MSTELDVRRARREDAGAWLELRCLLWPGPDAEHRREVEAYFAEGAPGLERVLLAEAHGRVVAFAELSVRAYAEGCSTSRVGYLEGWFVVPELRRSRAGRALVAAGEAWAREQGCTEFASDAAADNEVSRHAHLACGFEDAGLIRCFRKPLQESAR